MHQRCSWTRTTSTQALAFGVLLHKAGCKCFPRFSYTSTDAYSSLPPYALLLLLEQLWEYVSIIVFNFSVTRLIRLLPRFSFTWPVEFINWKLEVQVISAGCLSLVTLFLTIFMTNGHIPDVFMFTPLCLTMIFKLCPKVTFHHISTVEHKSSDV